jgi:hypothetical protein
VGLVRIQQKVHWYSLHRTYVFTSDGSVGINSRSCLSRTRKRGYDDDIPTALSSSIDDIADRVDVQHKPNDLCTGSITRAHAKLLEQQVNSLLTEYNLFTNENFILAKSLHVCMIRFMAEASMTRGGEELHEDNCKMVPIISESMSQKGKQEHHH